MPPRLTSGMDATGTGAWRTTSGALVVTASTEVTATSVPRSSAVGDTEIVYSTPGRTARVQRPAESVVATKKRPPPEIVTCAPGTAVSAPTRTTPVRVAVLKTE